MRRYAVVIEHFGANYSAYSPDIPGCVALGDSAEETLASMREAITLHLRGLREDGLPVPDPSSTPTYVEVVQ